MGHGFLFSFSYYFLFFFCAVDRGHGKCFIGSLKYYVHRVSMNSHKFKMIILYNTYYIHKLSAQEFIIFVFFIF